MTDCGCEGERLCFRHKVAYWRETGGLQVAPSVFPTRTPNIQKPRESMNSWERGIAKDERGVPYLRPENLEPMGVHEYASRRSELEEGRRKLTQASTTKD